MADDIVRYFVRQFRELHPETPDDELWNIELQARQVWGGTDVYVCKKATAGKVSRLAQRLGAGGSILEAFLSAGVPRSTGFRLMARRHRRWLDY